jgi:RimJ/RimL family protein N-acetyltransferase
MELSAGNGASMRLLRPEDVTASYVEGMRDPEVTRYMYGVKKSPQSWATVTDYVRFNHGDPAGGLFGVFADGTLRGTIRLHGIDEDVDSCHVGICIFDKRCWNTGLASRCLRVITDFVADELGLERIIAGVDVENVVSANLFARAGFVSDPADRYTLDGRATDIWTWLAHDLTPERAKPREVRRRLRLLIVGEKDYQFRDLVQTGLLDALRARFDLAFLIPADVTVDLGAYGPVRRAPSRTGWRLRTWMLGAGLQHVNLMRRLDVTLAHSVARATYGFSTRMRDFVALAARLHLEGPIARALRAVLRLTRSPVETQIDDVDVILASTSVKSALVDDLVRWSRRSGRPLLALQTNWDNIAMKGFFEVPPYIGVWGEQSFLIARLLHKMAAHRIFVIGTPRFEIYREAPPSQAEARRKFGLPEKGRILLFCGASVAFDETSLIEELDRAIGDGMFGHDVHVFYKPHFTRAARAGERALETGKLRHTTVYTGVSGVPTELDAYPAILAAADAIISPFSTMVMEGARHGLPALCLGYADPGHANHDWNRVAFNLHLYMIRHADWSVVCERRDRFLEYCGKLLALVGDPTIADAARASAEMVFKSGRDTVADRIIGALETISRGGHADASAELAKRA